MWNLIHINFSEAVALKKGRHEWQTKLLSNQSIVFEELIYSQINSDMSVKFSKYLTGFRKNYNTQHALLNIIENWKSNLNKGNKIGAIFMDLSKAFDTLDHSLLIAKLEAYGFDSLSLEFMKNYLTENRDVRSETVLIYGEKLHHPYRKVPYLDHCFLTSSYIYS